MLHLNLNVHCGIGVGTITGIHLGDDITNNNNNRCEYLILGNPIVQVSHAGHKANLGEVVASRAAVDVLVAAGVLPEYVLLLVLVIIFIRMMLLVLMMMMMMMMMMIIV